MSLYGISVECINLSNAEATAAIGNYVCAKCQFSSSVSTAKKKRASDLNDNQLEHDSQTNDMPNKREAKVVKQETAVASTSASADDTHFVESLDLNAPVICLCRDIAQGPTIKCLNENCDIGWYHFACVGLTEDEAATIEEWYCPYCKVNTNAEMEL